MSNRGLSHCPECGYDLRAHPPPNRCPECGFQYDEFTRVWRPKKPWKVYGAILLMYGFLVMQLPRLLMRRFEKPGVFSDVLFIIGLVCSVAVVWVFLRARQANKRGRYVAVTTKGIIVQQIGDPLIVPWSEIDNVVINGKTTSGIDIVTAGKKPRELNDPVTQHCMKEIVGSITDGAEFLDHAKRALAHYREMGEKPVGAAKSNASDE